MPEAPKNLRRICPFLGVLDDPETSLAFPSEVNYCHAAEPPGVPRFDHQTERCLALTYLGCPVYSAKEKGPLPAEIRLNGKGGGIRIKPQASWLVRSVGAFIIATLIFFIGWFGVAGLNRSMSESHTTKTKASLPVVATSTPLPPPATQTPFVSVIEQALPTASETPTPPLVGTPDQNTTQTNCGKPAGWVTYTVQPNDTLSRLSQVFGVTVAQLQNANCMGASTVLHVGRSLYVPYWVPNPVYPTLGPTLEQGTYVPTNTYSIVDTATPEFTTEAPTASLAPVESPTP